MTVTTAVRVNLEAGCGPGPCAQMALGLERQLRTYTKGAALMPIRGDLIGWFNQHNTIRKRAMKATRLGYRFSVIRRADYVDDIYDINVSKAERQGRPMSAGYNERTFYGESRLVCRRHHVHTYGVTDAAGILVAYLWLYRCGELALVSSILGHSDHLEHGVMYQLWAGMLGQEWDRGGVVFYNLWGSGTDGLRFYKQRVGLEEGNVEWAL